MPTRIAIFEDNDRLRETLTYLLKMNDYEVVGDYGRCDEAATIVRVYKPDVVLMDIDMPGINGIEAVKKIRAFNQQVQIIMLTVFDDNRHVLDAICAGASGYLLKKYISDHLPEAIAQVLQGEAPMSRGIARMVIQSMQESARPVNDTYHLTPREKEVLAHLSKGNSYKLIAAHFYISIDTVRSHIKNIYEKLKVHNQVEAVSKAAKERLL